MSDTFLGLLSEEEASFLEIYKEDLDAIPSFDVIERGNLLTKAKSGDDDAQGLLIQDFMRTALDVTHMYAGQGVLLQDLIGEGNLALVSFFKNIPDNITVQTLEQSVTEELVRVFDELIKEASTEESEKQKMLKKVEKVAAAAKKLSEERGRKVSIEELAEDSKISLKQIRDALKNTANKIEGIE
ncbi:MAG: hypothetical protein K6E19_06385 [Lachnospiraceae bacterium]|nr:hypothetical protein [Lachnospiraceae bacterium]